MFNNPIHNVYTKVTKVFVSLEKLEWATSLFICLYPFFSSEKLCFNPFNLYRLKAAIVV